MRVDPATGQRVIYKTAAPGWIKGARFIHMAFYTQKDKCNIWPASMSFTGQDMEAIVEAQPIMLAICSNLVDDEGINALVVFEMDPTWRFIVSSRWIPLPTQDSCIHRVAVIDEGMPPCDVSCVVTELSTSKLWQIKLEYVASTNVLTQTKEWRTQDGVTHKEFVEGATLVRNFSPVFDLEAKDTQFNEKATAAMGDGSHIDLYDETGRQMSDQLVEMGKTMKKMLEDGPAQLRMSEDGGKAYMRCLDISVMSVMGYDYSE